jgi:hypothetical protein
MTQTNDEAVTLQNKFLFNFAYFLRIYNKIQRYFSYSSNINPPYSPISRGYRFKAAIS